MTWSSRCQFGSPLANLRISSRIALASVLNQDHGITVVGEGLGYSELRRALDEAESAPHVVVLDEDMVVSAVINGLRDRAPGLDIVVITHGATPGSRMRRLRLQATPGLSCLSRNTSGPDICAAVHSAAGAELAVHLQGGRV
jgi:DNA-binding NarL/FixJ family response regulator